MTECVPAPIHRPLLSADLPQFETLFNQLLARTPLASTTVAALLLEPALTSNAPDPVHLQYIGRLVEKDTLSLANILDALLKFSPARPNAPAPAPDGPFALSGDDLRGREMLEQDLFLVLEGVVYAHKPHSSDRVWAAVQAVNEWMEAVLAVSGVGMLGDMGDGLAEAMDVPAKGRLRALGRLVFVLGMDEQVAKVLGEATKNEKKLAFLNHLAQFAQHVQMHDLELGNNLGQLRQRYHIQQSPKSQRRGLKSDAAAGDMAGILMGLGGDGDGMALPEGTRAHLFVWLEGLVRFHDELVIRGRY